MTRHKEAVLPVSTAVLTLKEIKAWTVNAKTRAQSIYQNDKHSRDWKRCPSGIF